MPKQRSPDRDKAKEIYLKHNGEIPLTEIADSLNLSEGTIRGWKAKDNWDGALNGTERIALKKSSERSNKNTERNAERSDKNKRVSSYNNSNKNRSKKEVDKSGKETNSEKNTVHPNARFGNQNAKGYGAPKGNQNAKGKHKPGAGAPEGNQYAVGNKGGSGGPIRNKKALTTGEYETVFFTADILDDEERALLNADYDKYIMQYLLLDTLTIREKRILKRIRDIETTPGGMVFDSVTKNKGKQTTKFINRNKDGEQWDGNDMAITQDQSSHVAKPVIKRVMELEDALTRTQARKQAAITQLHRMEMDDERLTMDKERIEIYKQRISGRVDLDSLFGDDPELDLDE